MQRLYGDTKPFYIRDLSILGFRICRVPEPTTQRLRDRNAFCRGQIISLSLHTILFKNVAECKLNFLPQPKCIMKLTAYYRT